MNYKYMICGIMLNDNITKFTMKNAKDFEDCKDFIWHLAKHGFLDQVGKLALPLKEILTQLKNNGKVRFSAYSGDGIYVIQDTKKIGDIRKFLGDYHHVDGDPNEPVSSN